MTGRVEAPVGAPAQGQLDTVIEQATEAEHTDDMVNHTAEQLLRQAASKILPDSKPTDFSKIHPWQRDVIADNGGNARHTLALWAHSVTIRGRRWHSPPLAAVAAVAMLGRPRFSELASDLVTWCPLVRTEQGAWRGTTRPACCRLGDNPPPFASVPSRNTGASVPSSTTPN